MIVDSAATRREFLGLASACVAALTLAPAATLAAPDQVAAEIRKLVGERQLREGRIKFDLPSIAENGLVVPLGFEVESPMTATDYVKAVYLFAEGNPNPMVAAFHFTPLSPKAAAAIRIRLAQTQTVVAVAELSTGEVYAVRKEVKVTIGGCGG